MLIIKGTLQNVQFEYNEAGEYGGGYAAIASSVTSSSGVTYTGNIAGISNPNSYNLPESIFTYDNIDVNLSVDINNTLDTLYSTYLLISDDTDFYKSTSPNLCYVREDQTNTLGMDGTSWTLAYQDIQDCINDIALTGGEIWVKTGTYKPTEIPDWKSRAGYTDMTEDTSFIFYDNVRLYGGFAGGESERSSRNFRDNPTYLSCNKGGGDYCTQLVMGADGALIDGFIFIDSGYPSSTRRRMANSLTEALILAATGLILYTF